ncbi:ROK family protein [Fulvivirga sediminis]|uniref:ROK family protein n=1 Tax=Fulvivirga sediminis TaxID=2803949 RepID=A0A937K323_9BACT|nr:ROK family protein [Fulvivirga sediminis]MBL3658497.1 ROK family protein [Fulvivirga sediminis]
MNISDDDRIVMTLDAGGTNFVFSAIQHKRQIIGDIILPSGAHDLNTCLNTILEGFEAVKAQIPMAPSAISFAFPGPADYRTGIIGDLANLPAFRGGVALGPMLEDHFQIPVFIGNDGDLFAYGEAMMGLLPEVNKRLEKAGIDKRYNNLLGITLGTGFGGGIVINNQLCEGDNAAGGEIWAMRNFMDTRLTAEEGVSIRAVQRSYSQKAGIEKLLTPKDIYDIAIGKVAGNRDAALYAYDEMALGIAESLANAATLLDGVIVIGGGIAGAYSLIASKIIEHLNGTIENFEGEKLPRLASKVYNIDDEKDMQNFLNHDIKEVAVPFSDRKVSYIADKRLPMGLSRLGTSQAIALGAYAIALSKIDYDEKVLK